MKYILLVFTLATLGCAPATIPTYSAEERISGALALVKSRELSFFSNEVRPWIHQVTTIEGEEILTPSVNERRFSEVYLRPGTYVLTLECAISYSYANPRVVITVESGRIYETSCPPGEKQENILGIKMVPTAQAKITDVTDIETP